MNNSKDDKDRPPDYSTSALGSSKYHTERSQTSKGFRPSTVKSTQQWQLDPRDSHENEPDRDTNIQQRHETSFPDDGTQPRSSELGEWPGGSSGTNKFDDTRGYSQSQRNENSDYGNQQSRGEPDSSTTSWKPNGDSYIYPLRGLDNLDPGDMRVELPSSSSRPAAAREQSLRQRPNGPRPMPKSNYQKSMENRKSRDIGGLEDGNQSDGVGFGLSGSERHRKPRYGGK